MNYQILFYINCALIGWFTSKSSVSFIEGLIFIMLYFIGSMSYHKARIANEEE